MDMLILPSIAIRHPNGALTRVANVVEHDDVRRASEAFLDGLTSTL